jgi:protein SCO1/2
MQQRSHPRRTRSLLLAGVLAGLGLLAAACGGGAPATASQPQPQPANGTALDRALPATVLSLPLVDQQGKVTSLASLHGKTVVLTDSLTSCQEVCPLTSTNFRVIDQAITKAGLGGQVQLLEVTVDPERDTPQRLAAYQQLFGASPTWSFLTGTPAQIATLWGALGVFYSKVPEGAGPPPTDWLTGKPLTYDVQHQDVVFVIDGQGHERWLITGTAFTGGVAPPAPLDRFLSDTGRTNLTTKADTAWTPADVESAVAWITGHPVGLSLIHISEPTRPY